MVRGIFGTRLTLTGGTITPWAASSRRSESTRVASAKPSRTPLQYSQSFGSLNYLPPSGGHGVHHAVEDYGLHRDLPPGRGREAQHVLFSPLDAVYEGERAPAGTVRRRGRPHTVAHLVADQGMVRENSTVTSTFSRRRPVARACCSRRPPRL